VLRSFRSALASFFVVVFILLRSSARDVGNCKCAKRYGGDGASQPRLAMKANVSGRDHPGNAYRQPAQEVSDALDENEEVDAAHSRRRKLASTSVC